MPRTVVLLALALAVVLSACGQKGPLYLRDNPPPGTKTPNPERHQPIPYPATDERDERGSRTR